MKRDCRTCQQRCRPYGVRRLKRLERLANDLEACCIRQAPELLQAVSDVQSESVAVPLALDLDASLYCMSKGLLSKPAKRLMSGDFSVWAVPSKPSPAPAPRVALLHHRPAGQHLCELNSCKRRSQAARQHKRVQGSSTSSCFKVAARPLSSERQSGTVAGSSSEKTGGSPTSSLPCAHKVLGLFGTEQSPALLHGIQVASLWPTSCGGFGYSCLRAVRQAHLSHL